LIFLIIVAVAVKKKKLVGDENACFSNQWRDIIVTDVLRFHAENGKFLPIAAAAKKK
jgi:hypothetical protein